MAKIPQVVRGTYNDRPVELLYSAILTEGNEIIKPIKVFAIELIDDQSKRVIRSDDENLKLWINIEEGAK